MQTTLQNMLSRLNEFRLMKKYCDVTLQIGDTSFDCHRVILAAALPYFHTMFDKFVEGTKHVIPMYDIDVLGMKCLLDFIYTSNISIDMFNVKCVLKISLYLGIDDLINQCLNFLVNSFDTCNVINVYEFAIDIGYDKLRSSALNYMQHHFEAIIDNQSYLVLQLVCFKQILASNYALTITEENILELIKNWVNYDYNDRVQHVEDLMSMVRFKYIPMDVIQKKILFDEFFSVIDIGTVIRQNIRTNFSPRTSKQLIYLFNSKSICNDLSKIEVVGYNGSSYSKIDEFSFKFSRNFSYRVVTMSNTFYCFLFNCNSISNQFRYFNHELGSWRLLNIPKSIVLINNLVSLPAANIMYVNGAQCDDNMYCYVCDMDQWHTVTKLNHSARCGTLVEHGNVFYCCGGEVERNISSTAVALYDPRIGRWVEKSPMMVHTSYAAGTVYNDEMYITGGSGNCVQVYNIRADKWYLASPMSRPREEHSLVHYKGNLWAFGGHFDWFEVYNPVSNSWYSEKLHEEIGENVVATVL